jgi:hypothetical protein
MRWIAVAVLSLAGCLENSDPPSQDGPVDAPGTGTDGGPFLDAPTPFVCPPPSGGCDLVVEDSNDCPSIQELCAPHICGAHDCCFCQENGTWGTIITDCFEGCGGGRDAGP